MALGNAVKATRPVVCTLQAGAMGATGPRTLDRSSAPAQTVLICPPRCIEFECVQCGSSDPLKSDQHIQASCGRRFVVDCGECARRDLEPRHSPPWRSDVTVPRWTAGSGLVGAVHCADASKPIAVA
jgi:hypothetical protein